MQNLKFPVVILCIVFGAQWQTVQAQKATPVSTEKSYLRIESTELYENGDPRVASIGVVGFDKNRAGHMDLTFMESEKEGKGLTLDAGGGYGYKGYVSMYAGLGLALGYNWDKKDVITTIYPEVGMAIDITKSFAITLSAKRYFKLYGETEDVLMLGVAFR